MIRALLHPLFIVSTILFLLHQLIEKLFAVNTGMAGRYLDNLLCMPIILSLFLAERRLFISPRYRLSNTEIFIATIYITTVAEILFPLWSNRFVADWFDVIFYFAGSTIFYLTHRTREEAFSGRY